MKIRSALMTAAVSLALAGLAGCGDEPDTTTTGEAPTTTTTPPAATTPPAGDTTATAPGAGDTAGTTTPPTGAAGGTTGAAGTTGAGDGADRTAGQSVDDATVTAKVKAALMAESGVDGTKINVDTVNGTVTLKGEVADKSMVDRAVQVAKGVEGVKDVDVQIDTGGAG